MDPWVVEVLRFGYCIPFLRVPPLSMEPIPLASFPNFHQGDRSGGCNSRDRGSQPSSSFFSGLLQPDVCRSEDLRVMESSDRPLGLHSLHFKHSLQEGNRSVCSFFSSSGRLDGLRRSQESILASPRPPGQSQVPAVCDLKRALPVSGSLLRPLHGSPGLHQGYDPNLVHSHQYWHSYASIPCRLVYSSQLSRGSSPGCQYCSLSLSGVGGCGKPGINQTSSQLIRFNIYVQFSMPRLSGLHRPGNASISLCFSMTYFCPPGCSPRPPGCLFWGLYSLAHLVPGGHLRMRALQLTTSLVGSPGEFLSGLRVERLPPGSSLVDEPRMPSSEGVSISTLTQPRLLVRRVRSRLGCSPRSRSRFRPLVSGRDFSFLKARELLAVERGLLRQPFHGRDVCRQLRSRGLSSQCRRHSFSVPQYHSPAYHPLVGTPTCSPGSPVHHGKSQCSGRLSLYPEPVQGSEWTLHMEVFLQLRRQCLVMIDLFATSANHRCSISFSPFRDPQAMGMDALPQSWDHLRT